MADSINIKNHGSLGVLWFIGWMFSVGFLKLGFWKGALAFFIWPYFLGGDIAQLQNASQKEAGAIEQVESQRNDRQ